MFVKYFITCIAITLLTYSNGIHAATIWVEGEKPSSQNVKRSPWWYDKVKTSELSGNNYISNWSENPGIVTYDIVIKKSGNFNFWIRANSITTSMHYKFDDNKWEPINLKNAIDTRNIAADGKPDVRFLSWIDIGEISISKGKHSVSFKFDSKNANHGSIDCFTLTDEYFLPSGTVRPGGERPKTVTAKGSWAFEPAPDRFSKNALLDLRSLNEVFAGEHGFITRTRDGKDFARGDGKPIRFWAMHSEVALRGPKALAEHAKFLAKRGVNIVRWHGHINKKDGALHEINTEAREQLWQYVAAMKKEGIYVTLSPYYPQTTRIKKSWGLNTSQERMSGLVFFQPKVQAAYKNWLKEIFTPVNPYTGIALKDDPAIAIIQMQNEDSLFFWTFDLIKDNMRLQLQEKFGEWAKSEYGSIEKALQKWGNRNVQGDAPQKGILGFYNTWELTSGGIQQKGRHPRLADQARFITELMRNWNAEVHRFLRKDIGCKQLLNAGNWRTADPLTLNDLERYSYSTAEVQAMNRYTNSVHIGKHNGWAVAAGDKYENVSRLHSPEQIPVLIKQPSGSPFIIPESNWVPPMYYQSEAPFLVSAYMSLGGVDGFYWYTTAEVQWRHPASANGFLPSIGKWTAATPEILGNFPAAALIYREGFLKRGTVAVHEHRSLTDMYNLCIPVISEDGAYDPNRDAGNFAPTSSVKSEIDRLAFLVGPVEVSYNSNPNNTSVTDISKYIDKTSKTVRSNTGELVFNYGTGLCTMNAPRAQGVTGFLKKHGGVVTLNDVVIKSNNDYATIYIVPLDNKPISKSQRLLIQTGTACRPKGWSERSTTWTEEKQNLSRLRNYRHRTVTLVYNRKPNNRQY